MKPSILAAYECADVPDHAYIDGYNTQLAIATLNDLVANGDKPFLLALGFMKPHLDWVAPKRYWDLHNPALREWAASSLSAGMRETFFGPLIRQVETRIVAQQGERWDRHLFERTAAVDGDQPRSRRSRPELLRPLPQ